MSYVIFKHNQEYGPRAGLEGPFHYFNGRDGRVLYYDPVAREYWDPRTDFYVPSEDVHRRVLYFQNSIFGTIKDWDTFHIQKKSFSLKPVQKKNLGPRKAKIRNPLVGLEK